MNRAVALLFAISFVVASLIMVLVPVSADSIVENSWVSKAPMRQARSGLGVAVVDGKIYAIGGSNQNGVWPDKLRGGVVGTNEEYDPATNTWTFKSPMPTPRRMFSIAVYQNKIYCIGGYLSNGTVTAVNEVYDPETDTWESKAPINTIRIGLEANVVSGKIYLIGGYTPAERIPLSLNEVYDPVTDSWTTKASIPQATSGYASAVVFDKIYVIGHSRTQIFDPASDTWRFGATVPLITNYGKAVATTGKNASIRIYLLGPSTYPINQAYDPATDTWTKGSYMPTERDLFGMAVLDDVLFVLGGSTENWASSRSSQISVYSTNEQYIPFGYGTPDPSFKPVDTAVPEITVASPLSQTYTRSSVPLVFTVDKPVDWLGYSLNGAENVTVSGNTTLTGLSSGSHNLTVFAKDTFGNTGASETVTFTVSSKSLPTVPIVAASGATVALAAASLIYYYKKRRQPAS